MRRSLGNLLLALLVAALVLAACSSGGTVATPEPGGQAAQTQKVPLEGGGSYTNLNAAGLATMLEKKDFILINVHIPYEGELPQTDAFIPYNEIEANADKLPVDKGTKIVVYCRSGSMSAIAAATLVEMGYSNLYNLTAGMKEWQAAGYELLNKGR